MSEQTPNLPVPAGNVMLPVEVVQKIADKLSDHDNELEVLKATNLILTSAVNDNRQQMDRFFKKVMAQLSTRPAAAVVQPKPSVAVTKTPPKPRVTETNWHGRRTDAEQPLSTRAMAIMRNRISALARDAAISAGGFNSPRAALYPEFERDFVREVLRQMSSKYAHYNNRVSRAFKKAVQEDQDVRYLTVAMRTAEQSCFMRRFAATAEIVHTAVIADLTPALAEKREKREEKRVRAKLERAKAWKLAKEPVSAEQFCSGETPKDVTTGKVEVLSAVGEDPNKASSPVQN